MSEITPGVARCRGSWGGVLALTANVSGGASTAISVTGERWDSAGSLWLRAAEYATTKLEGTWTADVDKATGKLSMQVSGYTGTWEVSATSSTATQLGIGSAMTGTAGGAAVLAPTAHPDGIYPTRAMAHKIMDVSPGQGEVMGDTNYASPAISKPVAVSITMHDTTAALWAAELSLVKGYRWDVWDRRRVHARVVFDSVKRQPVTKMTTGEQRLTVTGKTTHRQELFTYAV